MRPGRSREPAASPGERGGGGRHSDLARFAAATERVAKVALQAASVLLPSERRALIEAKIHAHAALVMMAARQKKKSVQHVLDGARMSWRASDTRRFCSKVSATSNPILCGRTSFRIAAIFILPNNTGA